MSIFRDWFGRDKSLDMTPDAPRATPLGVYGEMYAQLVISPDWIHGATKTASQIMHYQARYQQLYGRTGVPWNMIGVIHALEAGLSFTTHLHNGDPLTARTVQVPKGRPTMGNPPFTWEESATDALKGFRGRDLRTVNQQLIALEEYNGMGYKHRGVPSPYLWSGTQFYSSGKYVRDGVYDPNAVSKQVGCAALYKAMGIV